MKRKIKKKRGFRLVATAKTYAYFLTPKQRAALILAEAECNNPKNLVSHEEAVNQIEKWLNRPKKLTAELETELKAAIAETYDSTKLIDHEDVMEKYAKWLK